MATSGRGSGMVGYNVQAAVDTTNHLIVAHEVTNVGTDKSQLANTANQAKAALEAADIAGGPVSCAVAYKSPQSPTSSILRQSAFYMKTGADEFVLATNARRTHELTAQRIGAKVPQDGPRR
jgi:hypothetical protein